MIEMNGFDIALLMVFTILGWENEKVISFLKKIYQFFYFNYWSN